MTRRLGTRLVLAIMAVVFAGLGVAFLVARWVAPDAFRQGLRLGAGRGRGPGATATPEVPPAFESAVDTALWWGAAVALVIGAVIALYVARRIARPVGDMRTATRRMASGDYDVRVPTAGVDELADLAHDINHLAAELDATEERRRRLLSELAHELRTPLTTIDGYVEGLLDGVFEPVPETFAAIGEETSRLQRLAADLSLVSRAEEGALEYAWEEVDLAEIVAATIDRLRPQFAASGIEVGLDRPAGPVPVTADPVRLGQVLTNLVGNALGHAGSAVDVAVVVGRDGVAVTVTDDGDGIAPEDVERVFERFYRAEGTSRAGTGLGLTIARAIARAHRGDVTAASPGVHRGATFTLTLPRLDADR